MRVTFVIEIKCSGIFLNFSYNSQKIVTSTIIKFNYLIVAYLFIKYKLYFYFIIILQY
jgi:hypothetical protein